MMLAIGDQAGVPVSPTLGHGWAILGHFPSAPSGVERMLDACWLGILFFPACYWARRSPLCWAGVVGLLLLLAGVPIHGPLRSTPLNEWIAAGTGISGALLAARMRRKRAE